MAFTTPTRCITPSPSSSPTPSGFIMQDTPKGPKGPVSPVTHKPPVYTKPPTFADEHARRQWKEFYENDNIKSCTVNPKRVKRTRYGESKRI